MVNNKQSQTKNSGLSLVEVLISMLILATVVGGLANLFLSVKELTLHVHSRMVAGKLGRYFLDPLQMYVRQDTWDIERDPVNENPNTGGNLLKTPAGKIGYKTANNPFPDTYPDASYVTLTWMAGGPHEVTVDNNIYYPVYAVSEVVGLRKLKLTIRWEE